jgi:hypothetical protein
VIAKPPSGTLIRDHSLAPDFWARLAGPARTFAGDSGDIADARRLTPALVRTGGCVYAVGRRGPCLLLDGSTGYASGAVPALNNWTAQSVSLWVKLNPGQVDFTRIIEKGANNEWTLCIVGGQVGVQIGDTTAIITGTVGVSVWRHVVFTISTTFFGNLYVDGVFAGGAQGAPNLRNGPLSIGRFSGGGYNFGGGIDEIAIYNTELSPARVRRIFAAPDEPLVRYQHAVGSPVVPMYGRLRLRCH